MKNTRSVLVMAGLCVATLFGVGCAKKDPFQNTFVVEYWTGTNHHRAILNRHQYFHEFLMMPDYEAGEPNAKLE